MRKGDRTGVRFHASWIGQRGMGRGGVGVRTRCAHLRLSRAIRNSGDLSLATMPIAFDVSHVFDGVCVNDEVWM